MKLSAKETHLALKLKYRVKFQVKEKHSEALHNKASTFTLISLPRNEKCKITMREQEKKNVILRSNRCC